MALLDLEFGLVADGDEVPASLSGAETVADAIQIIMLLSPGDIAWLPGFGGNQSGLVWENMDPYLLARRAKDRITYLMAQWLPFVQIVDVTPVVEEFDKDDETIVIRVRFLYQSDEGEVDIPLGA